MAATGPSVTPPLDKNKAWGAAGAVFVGGLIMRPVAHFVNMKWPGAIDPDTLGDLTNLVAVGLAFVGAYVPSHST